MEEHTRISKNITFTYAGNVLEKKQEVWGSKNTVKMPLNDPLANVLSNIWNAEKIGKRECSATPSSKTIQSVLQILKDYQYIKDFKISKNERGDLISIELHGRINKCAGIKPRYSFKISEHKKFEKRFLPAKDFGILIISTNQGIMTNKEALEKQVGGRLLAYCY